MKDIRRLPKAHLHLHLVGSLRRSTYSEFAGSPDREVEIPEQYDSFTHFQTTISAAVGSMRTAERIARVTREVVEDAARSGAVWVEPSIQPGLLGPGPSADGPVLGQCDAAIDIALTAGAKAAAEFGVGFGLVISASRDRGPEAALATARLAASLMHRGVVGFGLDGDEVVAPATAFGAAFSLARSEGLAAVPHAGEFGYAADVQSAVTELAATRVMHGVRAADDPDLLARLADSPVTLDVCPSSNVALSVVPSLEKHPLPQLLESGVRCSVNADDPLLFGTSLLDEYHLCRDALGFSDSALAGVARTSITASGAPVEHQRRALADIDEWEDS